MTIRFLDGNVRYPVDIRHDDEGNAYVHTGTTPAGLMPIEHVELISTDIPTGELTDNPSEGPVDLEKLLETRQFVVYWANEELDAAPADDLVISGKYLWKREHLPEVFSGWACGELSRMDLGPYVALTPRRKETPPTRQ